MPEEAIWKGFFDVSNILDALLINESTGNLIEIGCGYGTFTIESAVRVSGEVYAFDIEPGMIESAKAKSEQKQLKNINFIIRDIISEGTGLTENLIDYAMLFNILHHSNPVEMLTEVFRVLKYDGKAGIVHWRSDIATPRGPGPEIRPKPEQCILWAEEAGFEIYKGPFILEPFHYGLIMKKPTV